MVGLLGKIFGKKKEINSTGQFISEQLNELIKLGKFELKADIESKKIDNETEEFFINLSGADKKLLTEKDGILLESLHSFLKRAVRNKTGSENVLLKLDCDGYRENSEKALINEAEDVKLKVIEQGKSFYLKAMSPKDRKTVHQYLSSDTRIKSRSVGDGLFKKIKVYPSKNEANL